jgi:hypothetical protein
MTANAVIGFLFERAAHDPAGAIFGIIDSLASFLVDYFVHFDY